MSTATLVSAALVTGAELARQLRTVYSLRTMRRGSVEVAAGDWFEPSTAHSDLRS
jgi:hypothetical protein